MKKNQIAESLRILKLYTEKAEKLKRLTFTKAVFGGKKSGFTADITQGQPVDVKRRGSSEEAIDAFLFTFRFFYHDKEKMSFRYMATLYNELPISDILKKDFHEIRGNINSLLDSSAPIVIKGESLLRRKIFEVLLWGGLSRANKEKKQLYDCWRDRYPLLLTLLEDEFETCLIFFLDGILQVHDLNQNVINELSKFNKEVDPCKEEKARE
jgi:hypothetical protein